MKQCYRTDSFSPLTIVLLGQPQLTETLRLQVLECIRQRITVYYQIPSLDEDEANPYIVYHLRVAGLDKQIFTDDAVILYWLSLSYYNTPCLTYLIKYTPHH